MQAPNHIEQKEINLIIKVVVKRRRIHQESDREENIHQKRNPKEIRTTNLNTTRKIRKIRKMRINLIKILIVFLIQNDCCLLRRKNHDSFNNPDFMCI